MKMDYCLLMKARNCTRNWALSSDYMHVNYHFIFINNLVLVIESGYIMYRSERKKT